MFAIKLLNGKINVSFVIQTKLKTFIDKTMPNSFLVDIFVKKNFILLMFG